MIDCTKMSKDTKNAYALGYNSPYGNHFPGKNVEGSKSKEEVLSRGGANFDVAEHALWGEIPEDPTGMMSGPLRIGHPEHKGIHRTDSGAALGVVGINYPPVQYSEAFDVLDHLIMQGHAAPLGVHVSGGGATCRIFSRIGGCEIDRLTETGSTRKDELGHFLNMKAGHTGFDAIEFELNTVCLTCLNGQTFKRRDAYFSIRHSGSAREKLMQANEAIKKIHVAAQTEANTFAGMAQTPMTSWNYRQFAEGLLNLSRGEINGDSTQLKRTRRDNDLSTLMALFVSGRGNHGASTYDAYNSITQWLTPDRESFSDPLQFEKKWESASSGKTANDMKANAMRVLISDRYSH